jgi:glycosyltransferase involved in cell wall biosynthesis
MRIGVDAREIQNGIITGIGRSLANFIEYFSEHKGQHSLFLFSENRFDLNKNGNIKHIYIGNLPTFVWDQLALPQAIKAHKIDLFYSPYYKLPLATRIPVINQILDLMYLGFPPYRKTLGIIGRFYYATFGKAFAKKSISIITDSEHAKGDIVKFWNIDQNKIKVIPLGLANRYKHVNDYDVLDVTKNKFNLPENFILYLGNFKPHKNVKSLVNAFDKIKDRYSDHKLVLAGTLDEHGMKLKQFVEHIGIAKRVVFTDTIRENDNPEALLSMAKVFVFPTLYEGFGLPPLEAMACGTPVIASNLTSVPEVVGDSGITLNPLDVGEISNAITNLIENPEIRKLLSKKGLERAKLYREKETTAKLCEHIISLLAEVK